MVDPALVSAKAFRVVLDSINGAGGVEGKMLLERLGCEVVHINAEANGRFAHVPEPLAENLTQPCEAVTAKQAVAGFVQDPDADRLAIVDENGVYIGEEYTLALAARYMFAAHPGPAAANPAAANPRRRASARMAAASGMRVLLQTPAPGYGMCRITASPNSEHFRRVAPSISRWKS